MKQIKVYEDFLGSNPEKRLISFSEFIYESRQTEDRARAILSEFTNKEDLILKFRQGDVSNNRINIPLMAHLYYLQESPDTEEIIDLVNEYEDLVVKKRIERAQLTRDGLKIGQKTFTNYLEFKDHIHDWAGASEEVLELGQEELDNFRSTISPLWSGNNIDIHQGDSVGKCITYTKGGLIGGKYYNFCIGDRGERNRYRWYRNMHSSTFYFIVDKNKFGIDDSGGFDDSDPLHLVVLDIKDRSASLTDATNKTKNYEDTNDYIEYLRGMGVPVDEIFKIKPKTEQERYEYKIANTYNRDLDWFKNLDNPKNPNWKKPKLEPGDSQANYYKSIYAKGRSGLSDTQFDWLIKYKYKSLLHDYVSTGNTIPVEQIIKLSKELRETYIRNRFISVMEKLKNRVVKNAGLLDYEFELLSQEKKNQYLAQVVETGSWIRDEEFEQLTQEQKEIYLKKKLADDDSYRYSNSIFGRKEFEYLTPDQRFEFAKKRKNITSYQFELLTPEQQKIFKKNGGKIN